MEDQHYSAMLFLVVIFMLLSTTQLALANQLSNIDIAALRQIKTTLTDIPHSDSSKNLFFSTWNFSSPDPCSSFAGITCSLSHPQRVTSLSLGTGFSNSPGLSGTLSPSIYSLTELTQLVLFPGIVHGSIPPQLGLHLKNLRVISLTNNKLTGTIPLSISNLQNLHTLDLSHNQLTGKIPPGLTNLPELRVLVLASNTLSRSVPEFSNNGGGLLLHLDLGKNKLYGMLPEKMPLTLRYLSVSENGLWGPIKALESLSELVYLDLSMNRFSGPIPTSLFCPSLSSLFLQRNYLSGRVPLPPPLLANQSLSFSSYGSGSTVDLSHNFLTGKLSTILDGVENLFINNNRLTGEVPDNYARSVFDGRTKTLYLQHNYLTSFWFNNDSSAGLPETAVAVCLSYNCMALPAMWVTACPASAGVQLSRPLYQCASFNNGSSITP